MRIVGIVGRVAALAAAAAAGGCVDQQEGAIFPQEPPATMTVTWTVEGEATPEACAAIGADRIEIEVLWEGEPFFFVDAPCERFSLGIELPNGNYVVEAVLVDEGGQPQTEVQRFEGVPMRTDQDFVMPIAF